MAGELTEGIIPHLPLWNSRVRHAGDLQVPGRKAPFCGRTSLILLWLFTGPWVSSPQRPMSLGKMSLRSCLVTASWRYQNFLLSESINIWTRIKRLYLEISFSVILPHIGNCHLPCSILTGQVSCISSKIKFSGDRTVLPTCVTNRVFDTVFHT